jgi:hypothetical protein
VESLPETVRVFIRQGSVSFGRQAQIRLPMMGRSRPRKILPFREVRS